MYARIRKFLAPPVFEGDEDKTRTARLLNTILLALLVVVLLSSTSLFVVPNVVNGGIFIMLFFILVLAVLLVMRSGRVALASWLMVGANWILDTIIIVMTRGLVSPMISGYVALLVMGGLLLGGRAAVLIAVLNALAGLGMVYAASKDLLPAPILFEEPFAQWTVVVANSMIVVALLYLALNSIREALQRARRTASELAEERATLEDTVTQRTRELTRRTNYLEATADVSRQFASELDLQALLDQVVQSISARFSLYHVGLFMLDESREWAVLQAASSAGGRRMLERGHRLSVGQVGVVGYVTGRGEARIALDVGGDAELFDNPDLHMARSEMALPLRVRGQIIGALDVQSAEAGAFSDEDMQVFQILADQIATTISNAQLFQKAEQALQAERRAFGELSRTAWQELISTRQDLGYLSDERGTSPAEELWEPQMERAVIMGEAARDEHDGRSIAIPIKVADRVIGVIDGRKAEGAGQWTQDETELLEALSSQLNVALEGARLYGESRQRVLREQMVGEIATNMRESLEIERVLQTAAQEIGQAMGLAALDVRLSAGISGSGGDQAA